MVDSICKELVIKSLIKNKQSIETIYFGGGTPSVLSNDSLIKIINTINNNFQVTNPEITIECNPDDLNSERLKHLKSIGFNRLSIGIQSFNDNALKFMNRCHTGKEAEFSVKSAQDMGFENINLDLIFGIPSFDKEVLYTDLEKIISLTPKHISTYCMTIEEKTVFGSQFKKGLLSPCSDDISSQLYNDISARLTAEGFDHYEISNFGKPNYYSKHNLSYWQDKVFIGVGPSAHSFDGEKRFINVANNTKYIQLISNNKEYFEIEELSTENKANEYIMTKLRTMWGIDLVEFNKKFKSDWTKDLELNAQKWINSNDMINIDNHLLLSQQGKLLADSICADLFY
jgi:oxygen-independent coproporphyrinogen III oxidase